MPYSDQKTSQLLSKLFKTNMMAGLLIVVPILLTCWVGWWSISITTDWAVHLLDYYNPDLTERATARLFIRIITIIILLTAVFLIGLLAKATIGKQLIHLAHKIMLKLPILSIVYSTCQQIGETVKTQQGGLFKQVVLFEYPRKGSWSIGFITSYNEQETEITQHFKSGVYSVFMPTTPNPTSGFLFYIPKEDCILLEMSSSDAMKLIVSGGVVTPPKEETEKEEDKEAKNV